MLDKVIKILDAASGESSEVKSLDGLLTYKYEIVGTPVANIKIFYKEQMPNSNLSFVKIYCSDWGSASVRLLAKSTNDEDIFSNVGNSVTKDELKLFNR